NMTGLPAIAIPSGFSRRNLPLSLAISGRPFAEATVLRVAHAFQQATEWHRRHPDLDAALAAPLDLPESEESAPAETQPPAPTEEAREPQPEYPSVVHAEVTEQIVRVRAAIAGVEIDDEGVAEAARALEATLKALRPLDPHAIRRVEPAVTFTALGG